MAVIDTDMSVKVRLNKKTLKLLRSRRLSRRNETITRPLPRKVATIVRNRLTDNSQTHIDTSIVVVVVVVVPWADVLYDVVPKGSNSAENDVMLGTIVDMLLCFN